MQAQADAQVAQIKAQADTQVEQMRLQGQAQRLMAEQQHQAQMERMKLEMQQAFDKWQAELQAATQIEVALIGAGKKPAANDSGAVPPAAPAGPKIDSGVVEAVDETLTSSLA
jgi:hypothetical protein